MKKRVASLILLFALCLSFNCNTASATELSPYSSKIIDHCSVDLFAGSGAGEIQFSFDLATIEKTDSLGIASIKIYTSNTTYVTTIAGTPSNGLIRFNANRYVSTYTYTGISGMSYYAEVTVAAAAGSLYDSRTITTNTVKAP